MSDMRKWRLICELANDGADTEAKKAIICTPLYLAACSRRLEAIQAPLKLGPSMQFFGEMDTPAHISVYRGNVDCMRALIGAGYGISTTGRESRTVLNRAMFGRQKW